VVDVANVMGARADGWWRDRAGAALRLCQEVVALADHGIRADLMAGPLRDAPADAAGQCFPSYVLVLEGQAREAAARISGSSPRVRVVSAAGSGDDTIVSEVAALDGSCLVVTADRELRRRCLDLGAAMAGPGWLLGLL
jgi:8-oxo-dGTP diphosphatase